MGNDIKMTENNVRMV